VTKQEIAIRKLVSAHKVGNAIVPLLKAVEHNKRTREIEHMCISQLVKHVVEMATTIILAVRGFDQTESSDDLLDKIINILSRVLSNEIILYNNPSLEIFVDEIIKVLVEHNELLGGDLVGEKTLFKDVNEPTSEQPENTSQVTSQAMVEVVIASVTEMFHPVWLFHNNLYVSGFISIEQLSELNTKVSSYLMMMLQSINRKVGSGDSHLDASLFLMSSKVCAASLDGFQKKLIKKTEDIEKYIQNPIIYLDRIKDMFFVNFSVMNKETKKVLDSLSLA